MKLETKLAKWPLTKWKKEFWKVFSEYIKKRDKNICFTCGAQVEGVNSHAGHYRTGATCKLPLYFDERNVHCQCFNCNINLSGNWYPYQARMHAKYGKEIDAEFDVLNQKVVQYDKMTYWNLIQDYEKKLKALQV